MDRSSIPVRPSGAHGVLAGPAGRLALSALVVVLPAVTPPPAIPAAVVALALIRLMFLVMLVRALFALLRPRNVLAPRTFGSRSHAPAPYKDLSA